MRKSLSLTHTRRRHRHAVGVAVQTAVLLFLLSAYAPWDVRAQSGETLLSESPKAWAEAASSNQLKISRSSATAVPLRFRVRRVDAKGDLTREIVEAREGNVARLVERNGQPLSADENKAEIERLEALRKSPGELARHRKDDSSARSYAEQLIGAMPTAMRWSYAPGQPQLPGVTGRQIVLDFEPDPAYKPPTIVLDTLTGLAGRLWVDARSRCVLRVEGRVLHQVDYGWGGMLARIRPGGTITFEQVEAAQARWTYSQVEAHLTMRELLVHSASENTRLVASDWHVLPAPLSFEQAIDQLLAIRVAIR